MFNRPEATARLLELLSPFDFDNVYFLLDGPRNGHPSDGQRCEEVRAMVARYAMQKPRVYISTTATNMGLRKRIETGLDWVFSIETHAIILEDDCLPSASWLRAAAYYLADPSGAKNAKVSAICGFNRFPRTGGGPPFGFFRCPWFSVWGWATWSCSWMRYRNASHADGTLASVSKLFTPSGLFCHLYFIKGSFLNYMGFKDSWAYPWCYYNYRAGYYAVYCEVNCVENVGFGVEATHTKVRPDLPDVYGGDGLDYVPFSQMRVNNEYAYRSALTLMK